MKRKRGRPKKSVVEDPIPAPSFSAPPPSPPPAAVASVNGDDEAAFLNFVGKNVNEDGNESSQSVQLGGNDRINDVAGRNFRKFNAEEFSLSSAGDEEEDDSEENGSSFHLSDEEGSHKRVKSVANRSKKNVDADNVYVNVNAPVAADNVNVNVNTAAATVTPPRGGGIVLGLMASVMSSRGKRGAYSRISRKQLSQMSKRVTQDSTQDLRYDEKSLKAALSVIKKVMQMDEAVPFNYPADPIAQGIPDYVDMPMDFETICGNLRNCAKYMNSDDVYKDVEQIWENCRRSNKKGDYIIYLLKIVKKKFMKYWKAAGLLPMTPTGNSHFAPSSDHAMRHNGHDATSVVNHLVNSNNMLQGKYGNSQRQVPAPSTSQVPHYSQFRGGLDGSYTARVMNGSAHSHQQQPQLSSHLWQSEQSMRQTQPSHSNIGPDNTTKTGNLHSPPMDGLTKHVPRSSTGPTLSGMSQQQVPHHLPNHNRRNETHQPEETIAPHRFSVVSQLSKPLGSTKISCSGVPQTDADRRERREMQMHSADPGADIELASGNSLPEKPSASHNQIYKGKVRGRPSRCLFTGDLLDGERIHVPINMLGQPVGPEAAKLASFLGTVARDCKVAPVDVLGWHSMPEANRENMWQFVQTKFEIDPICKKWVMKSIAGKWRNWKAKLKAEHYNPHTTDQERLRDCDKRVLPDQWAALVAHWNTEEMKIRCATNKANRAKQKSFHAAGSKSFARIREEEQSKRPDGKELTRSELYILTRTRKDGTPVDKNAANMISKLREVKQQQNSDGSNDSTDTFSQVMGEGKCRQVGPSPREIYGPKPSSHSLIRMAMEAKRLSNDEVKKMMNRMEAMEKKCMALEAQIATISSSVRSLVVKVDASLKQD